MTYKELLELKPEYDKFNALLFNNSLPKSTEIMFSLNDNEQALAFSRKFKEPILGYKHELSFKAVYCFEKEHAISVMIHEMIHVWQSSNVSDSRYECCSQDIAHDRVFTCKMQTINIALKRFGYETIPDLSVVYDGPEMKKDYRKKGIL